MSAPWQETENIMQHVMELQTTLNFMPSRIYAPDASVLIVSLPQFISQFSCHLVYTMLAGPSLSFICRPSPSHILSCHLSLQSYTLYKFCHEYFGFV